jgi:hypothetical protein
LQAHKAAFREVFGETLSDEFVDEMLTRLVTALAPGPWDVLEAATLNAAIALIAGYPLDDSRHPYLLSRLCKICRSVARDIARGQIVPTLPAAHLRGDGTKG